MRVSRMDEVANAFRVEALQDLSPNERDELERAVSEKAPAIVAAADFAHHLYHANKAETEMRVWLDVGLFPACVAVHWEDRLQKFYFLVLDSTGKERMAAVVFEDLPCVSAEECEAESRFFLDTLVGVLKEKREMEMMDTIAALQSEYRKTRGATEAP